MAAPTVLLTGATGFIGGATLARLLTTRPDCRVLLLARDRGPDSAAQRVQNSLARFVGTSRAISLLQTCEIIPADLMNPDSLGVGRLSDATHVLHLASLKKLAGEGLDDVSHVLHLASNTNFRSVRGVRHTNVLGALTLAHRMRRAKALERFVYVGTSYICGENSQRIVRKEMFPKLRARHFTEYTASKAECEMLLESTAPELPLVVARPSVVVGHTELGCGPSASIYWFYRACHLLRRLTCPLESRDDVVPVDWVAEALLLLLFKPRLQHRRYHLSAGEGSSATWSEIAETFARHSHDSFEDDYQEADALEIVGDQERLAARLGEEGIEHLRAVLPIYYRFMQVEAELFDNARLLAEGMTSPPKFTAYLDRCIATSAGSSVYQQMLDDV